MLKLGKKKSYHFMKAFLLLASIQIYALALQRHPDVVPCALEPVMKDSSQTRTHSVENKVVSEESAAPAHLSIAPSKRIPSRSIRDRINEVRSRMVFKSQSKENKKKKPKKPKKDGAKKLEESKAQLQNILSEASVKKS